MKQANQAVDDATWRRDQAQKRLDQLKAEGKDAEKAQHSLDVANRELTDAKERQAQATNKLTDAQNATVEESAGAAEKTGGGFDDLGKSLWGGLLETIGLDGSVFSNPFEWPNVKSAMAGVNWLGGMLKGGETTAGASTGSGDPLSGLLNAASGAVASNLAPANVAPDTTQHGAGAGAAPGPAVVIEHAGMAPKDVANTLDAQWNARTRTTTTH